MIKSGSGISDKVEVNQEIRQKFSLSPTLFNIYVKIFYTVIWKQNLIEVRKEYSRYDRYSSLLSFMHLYLLN